MSKYTTQDLHKEAGSYFNSYPKQDVFFATTDGQFFFKETFANSHARSKDLKVHKISRYTIEAAEKVKGSLADAKAKKEAEEAAAKEAAEKAAAEAEAQKADGAEEAPDEEASEPPKKPAPKKRTPKPKTTTTKKPE